MGFQLQLTKKNGVFALYCVLVNQTICNNTKQLIYETDFDKTKWGFSYSIS